MGKGTHGCHDENLDTETAGLSLLASRFLKPTVEAVQIEHAN